MVHFPNLEKKNLSTLIVVFLFSATLCMVFLICIFHHLWYRHFNSISSFLVCDNYYLAKSAQFAKKCQAKTQLTGDFVFWDIKCSNFFPRAANL